MPHDVNGALLKVGDKVMIPATVQTIYEAEACNLVVECDNLKDSEFSKTLTVTAAAVEKVEE